LGCHHINPVNASKAHSRDSLQFSAEVKPWRILGGCRLCLGLLRLVFAGWSHTGQAGQLLLQLRVAFGDSFLVVILHLYFLVQHK
jgi:hypothetical protein